MVQLSGDFISKRRLLCWSRRLQRGSSYCETIPHEARDSSSPLASPSNLAVRPKPLILPLRIMHPVSFLPPLPLEAQADNPHPHALSLELKLIRRAHDEGSSRKEKDHCRA